jgi:hypothetical protein
VSTTIEHLVQRASELGALVGQAAVDSGDHARFIAEGDDTDELRCNLWTGSADGEKALRKAVAVLDAPERAGLPTDEVLWDQLYEAWHAAYEVRVSHLLSGGGVLPRSHARSKIAVGSSSW